MGQYQPFKPLNLAGLAAILYCGCPVASSKKGFPSHSLSRPPVDTLPSIRWDGLIRIFCQTNQNSQHLPQVNNPILNLINS